MSEIEKLREVLRCIADLPMDRCSTENDYRLSAAKAIALGALSQQAEAAKPVYPPKDTWPEWANWCGLDPSGYWVFYEREPVTSDVGRTPSGGSWGKPVLDEPQPCWQVMLYPRNAGTQAEPAPAQDEREFNTSDSDLTELLNIAADMLKGVGGGMDLGIYFATVLERVEQRLATRPAQTGQQPIRMPTDELESVLAEVEGVRDLSDVAHGWYEATECIARLNAAPFAQTAPAQESEHHARLLGQALGECIAAAGIIRPDASLSGPELLMFADDLKRHLAEQTAPLDADTLAEIIRKVDGNHSLGAGVLAERIVAELSSAPSPAKRGDA